MEFLVQQEPWAYLQDKVVLVTGASSGLGWDLCRDLAKAGCKIVAAARRVDRLMQLCELINGCSVCEDGERQPRAAAIQMDVSADGCAIDHAVETAWDVFGRIDVLVNNAGVRGTVKSALDLEETEWKEVMKTNLTGTWLVSKSVCSRMRSAGLGGSVINISSIAGIQRGYLPGALAYSCSKSAVNVMTKVMALEFGEFKIRVNSINPGLFKSEITEKLMRKDWLEKITAKTVPLQTLGTPDPAIFSLVRYLIHETSQYVTGNNFIVDAGATLPGFPIFSSL